MSRAFVKESDGESPDDGLPERPESTAPNYVTVQGLADLRRRLEQSRAEQERLRVSTASLGAKATLARLARDVRYLEHRIESAILVETNAAQDTVHIGSTVTIDDGQKRMTFTIVGEDQADPASGFISWMSPLGTVLVGSKRGDSVTWRRPVGNLEVTIVELDA
jgi:transcription elongation factor GreB